MNKDRINELLDEMQAANDKLFDTMQEVLGPQTEGADRPMATEISVHAGLFDTLISLVRSEVEV